MATNDQLLEKLLQISGRFEIQNILNKKILSFTEACLYLDLSESYVYKLTSKKNITHFCPQGKKIYFLKDDLDQWILRNRQSTVDEIQRAADQFKLNDK